MSSTSEKATGLFPGSLSQWCCFFVLVCLGEKIVWIFEIEPCSKQTVWVLEKHEICCLDHRSLLGFVLFFRRGGTQCGEILIHITIICHKWWWEGKKNPSYCTLMLTYGTLLKFLRVSMLSFCAHKGETQAATLWIPWWNSSPGLCFTKISSLNKRH